MTCSRGRIAWSAVAITAQDEIVFQAGTPRLLGERRDRVMNQYRERPRGRFRAHLHRRRSARAQGNPRYMASYAVVEG
jgi:hypothetical protein